MKKIIIFCLAILTLCESGFDAKSRRHRGKNIIDPTKPLTLTPAKSLKEELTITPSKEIALNEIQQPDTLVAPPQTVALSSATPPHSAIMPQENISKKETPALNKIEEKKETKEIYLNFENADLINFVNYIADLQKISILPDKALTGNKISLTTRKPLNSAQAFNILHTILDISGFSLIKDGTLYKIVPNAQKMTQPLQTFINIAPHLLPSSDEAIRYVTFLNNIKATDVKGLLDSFLGNPHIVIAQDNVNALIISDKSNNIKSAMKIVHELDKNGQQEAVVVLRLKERNATEVETLLKNLIEDKTPNHPLAHLFKRPEQMNSFFGPTKIFSDERLNALILIGTKDATLTIENFVKEHIDIALKAMQSPLHIYELQYMDAKQIVDLLKDATANPESITGQEASKYGAVRGGTKYFKNMTFKADEEGNRIIVSTPDIQDWKLLKPILKDLDKPQPQVALETLVVIVESTNTDQLGGQFRNKSEGSLGSGINFQGPPIQKTVLKTDPAVPDGTTTVQNVSLLGNLLNGLTGALGQTILTFGKPNDIWGIFQMLQSRTRSSIVAQPFLTVTNKYAAEILVGTTNRIVSQQSIVNGQQVSGYQDTEANLKIAVTPQINLDGIVNLKINIAVNDFGANSNITFDRNLETSVSVANGQVLALGGFVQTTVQESIGKVPILGDIPILGWAFKNRQKVVTKENILIFMCPTIIKPRTSPGINLYTRMKIQQAKQNINFGTSKSITNDPVSNWFFNPDSKDYSRKIDDFATARYQPVTVDIKNDEYYRAEKVHLPQSDQENSKEDINSSEEQHDS